MIRRNPKGFNHLGRWCRGLVAVLSVQGAAVFSVGWGSAWRLRKIRRSRSWSFYYEEQKGGEKKPGRKKKREQTKGKKKKREKRRVNQGEKKKREKTRRKKRRKKTAKNSKRFFFNKILPGTWYQVTLLVSSTPYWWCKRAGLLEVGTLLPALVPYNPLPGMHCCIRIPGKSVAEYQVCMHVPHKYTSYHQARSGRCSNRHFFFLHFFALLILTPYFIGTWLTWL